MRGGGELGQQAGGLPLHLGPDVQQAVRPEGGELGAGGVKLPQRHNEARAQITMAL